MSQGGLELSLDKAPRCRGMHRHACRPAGHDVHPNGSSSLHNACIAVLYTTRPHQRPQLSHLSTSRAALHEPAGHRCASTMNFSCCCCCCCDHTNRLVKTAGPMSPEDSPESQSAAVHVHTPISHSHHVRGRYLRPRAPSATALHPCL